MDNLIRSWFFSLQQHPGDSLSACSDYRKATIGIVWFGTLRFRSLSFPFELCHVFGLGFQGIPQLWMQECETAHTVLQFSAQPIKVTMKVTAHVWTLGPCLGGDGTPAESTWGVNSLWSKLNYWREEWKQLYLHPMSLILGNIMNYIYTYAGSSVTGVLVPALRQHSVETVHIWTDILRNPQHIGALLETMLAVCEDVSTDGDSLNGCW